MFKQARPFFLMVETPLHAGCGSDLGVVDLPIQREKHTGIPKVEASGLKGCIREAFEDYDVVPGNRLPEPLVQEFPGLREKGKLREAINLAFGPEDGDLHAGALGFTDARLLLFPVRSMRGVFGWVTCPAIISKFIRELKMAGLEPPLQVPPAGAIPRGCGLLVNNGHVILEEYTFALQEDAACTNLAAWLARKLFPASGYEYWREKMQKDLVVLADDDCRDFVNLATEVITRTRIDAQTGTVARGALFTEEYLPQESVLYALALAAPVFHSSKGIFAAGEERAVLTFWQKGLPEFLQLGGNATIGKGIVRLKVLEEG
ncbi:type III-B CRISPR module RAMP protein Cmr4 [Moorella sp. Hama-1]|uniref:type III-B CRISPR module RAMP protein Cmr4 n=1 Tax=Moorella sp. Hama-1 TaxID=2138101 RepID=UPI000D659337|nr:type III-B CRISPR module RAMP protein Cmr4 [Moorella sp. Hama-1]BCV20507.1 type III-B CRISPR module RAMP protein Cmr4 [Moorella sp. Hama-1]